MLVAVFIGAPILVLLFFGVIILSGKHNGKKRSNTDVSEEDRNGPPPAQG